MSQSLLNRPLVDPVDVGSVWIDDIAPWDMVLVGRGSPVADCFDEVPLVRVLDETEVTEATDVPVSPSRRAPALGERLPIAPTRRRALGARAKRA